MDTLHFAKNALKQHTNSNFKIIKMKKYFYYLLAITMMIATSVKSQIINTIAGTGNFGFSGDGGLATSAELHLPPYWQNYGVDMGGLTTDTKGNLYIADSWNNRIRKVNSDGIITTIVGGGTIGLGDGGNATSAMLSFPSGVAVDANGNIYIGDYGNNRIRKVDLNGIITTIAGDGVADFSGDGGSATGARITNPSSLAVDLIGNIYFVDYGNNRIRKINTNGIISTVAGNGTQDYTGDGGSALAAAICTRCVAVDRSGNLYFADDLHSVIRKIDTKGIITTIAGSSIFGRAWGFSGDGGSAILAQLAYPMGVSIDAIGNLYIADTRNNRIRKVDTNGIISTIAGNGTWAYTGDGDSATKAALAYPTFVSVDAKGNLYIQDLDNYVIRKVSFSNSIRDSIKSFSPKLGLIGTNDTILGIGFIGATSVSFGGIAASSFNVVNDSTIIAVVGDCKSGKVYVTNARGGIDSISGFNFISSPSITSFSPTNGCSSTIINITGSNLNGATSVTIGGTPATSFIVNSASSITATVPPYISGQINVTTPLGTANSNVNFKNTSGYVPYAYCLNTNDANVSVINTNTNNVVTTIAVGNGPFGISISPDGNNAYVADNYSNTVSVINTTTNLVTATIPVGSAPNGICVSPDGSKLFVANFSSNNVSVINATNNTVASTIPLGNKPYGICITPDGSKIFVTNEYDNTVSVINTTTNLVTATILVGKWPLGICISPDGTTVYVVNNQNNSVSIINTTSNTVLKTIVVGNYPYGINISPDGSKVYVANESSNTVSVITTSNNSISDIITVSNPVGVSFNPDGTKAYVTNFNQSSVSVINTVTNTVTGIISVGGNPSSFGNFIANVPTACPLPDYIWIGTTSTDWNDATNWSSGVVPSSTSDVTIPITNNNPTIANGSAYVRNLALAAGETLTNNGTLNVSGDLTNNGTITNGNSSNVVLAGTGTLSGKNMFANLEIQGNYIVGSTTSDKLSVTGILKKTSGTLNTSDKLTLVSNAFGSALIQENGGTLNGKAYIQHYTSGNFGYHHFSSPVSSATVSSWSNSFPITGANGASSWVSSKVGTLQWYDEIDNTTSLLDSSYYNYTSLSGALTPGKGFTAWLNSLPTLNTFGIPNNGTITIPVTHTAGSNAPRGWNFVGNPYPSPISWTALKSLNPGLFGDASCYLWKSSGGKNGVWQVFDGTVGANGAGDIINSSLGFFVYVNATGTFTFNNSVRSYSFLSPEIFGTNTAANQIRVSVNDAVSGETDEAVAYTSNAASVSRKMAQPLEAKNPTIAFDVNGTKAAIDVIKTVDANTVLPLTISTPKAGSYTLKIAANNTTLPVYLKDAVAGTYTDVKANGEVFITTTATETANRYSLVFSQPIVEANNAYNVFAKANSIIVTNPVNTGATIVVYNTLGQQVARTIATSNTTTITVSSTSAHYVVKIMDNKGANVVKQVIIR